MQKRLRLPLLVLVLVCPASTHLQPFLLKSLGALDGSFGLRPMSRACADLRLNGASIGWLSAADFRFKLGAFSVRYWVDNEA